MVAPTGPEMRHDVGGCIGVWGAAGAGRDVLVEASVVDISKGKVHSGVDAGFPLRKNGTSRMACATFPRPGAESDAQLEPASPPARRVQRHDALASGERGSSDCLFFLSEGHI